MTAERDREEGAPGADAAVEAAVEIEGDGLVEMVLAELASRPAAARIDGVVVGRLAGLTAAGEPLVDFDDNAAGRPLLARSATALDASHEGRAVALLFERGDPARPIVMGLMRDEAPAPEARPSGALGEGLSVESDGERVVLSAEREIVLRCGDASITLTRAGKILIRGAYVLSRATGVQRIQGGSVQIN